MGNSDSKNNSGTGNINYSLNKKTFKTIFGSASGIFVLFYYILLILSFIYIFSLKVTKYRYKDYDGKIVDDKNTLSFFESLTLNSPFDILSLRKFQLNIDHEENHYIGLSIYSYMIIILVYVICFIILLNGLLKNFILSVVLNIIQTNRNNNPYNNPNCVSKINEKPYTSVVSNYFTIITLSLVFLLPFLIKYIKNFLGFDNYDIKKSSWFNYIVLFLILSPLIIIIITRASVKKKLDVFPHIYKFIDNSDYPYVDYIKSSFSIKFSTISVFLLIFFAFIYLIFIYCNFQILNTKHKIMIYLFIFSTLFLFIPVALLLFCYLNIFSSRAPPINSSENTKEEENIVNPDQDGINEIKSIEQNGVLSLYQLLVKYNYPCFFKARQ